MDALEELCAIQEIRNVIARYSISFDDQDWETFATLWAEEAAFVVEDVAYEGRDELLAFLQGCLPEGYVSKHMNSTPLIEIAADGSTATANTDVVWIASNFENTIVGRYMDTFVKRDGRWLFLRRAERPVPYVPGPPPMSDQATEASSSTMRP